MVITQRFRYKKKNKIVFVPEKNGRESWDIQVEQIKSVATYYLHPLGLSQGHKS